MQWKSLGRVFAAVGQFGWMNSHAQIPTILPVDNGKILRVYFATRPTSGCSVTGYLDLDANNPTQILNVHDKPILELGSAGAFDEHGIMPQCCVRMPDSRIYLYYSGWSKRIDIPYSNWTGLAISDDDGLTFNKVFSGPIIDRTPNEIYSATGLFASIYDGVFRGWYAMGLGWQEIQGRLEEKYLITEALSEDGIVWSRDGKVVVRPRNELEAMTRPTVVKIKSKFYMWYCARSLVDFRDGAGSYRIGCAVSEDGNTWNRKDELADVTPSADGWDSKMQAYPYVIRSADRLYMFYNGNGFGASGFGVAESRIS